MLSVTARSTPRKRLAVLILRIRAEKRVEKEVTRDRKPAERRSLSIVLFIYLDYHTYIFSLFLSLLLSLHRYGLIKIPSFLFPTTNTMFTSSDYSRSAIGGNIGRTDLELVRETTHGVPRKNCNDPIRFPLRATLLARARGYARENRALAFYKLDTLGRATRRPTRSGNTCTRLVSKETLENFPYTRSCVLLEALSIAHAALRRSKVYVRRGGSFAIPRDSNGRITTA